MYTWDTVPMYRAITACKNPNPLGLGVRQIIPDPFSPVN